MLAFLENPNVQAALKHIKSIDEFFTESNPQETLTDLSTINQKIYKVQIVCDARN
jgi:hypothetical protein